MKRNIITLLTAIALVTACTKSKDNANSNSTNNPGTPSTSYPNKLNVVDNGSTLAAEGVGTTSPTQPMVILVVQKYSTNSVIQISTASNNFKDFNLVLQASEGPTSGIGNYVIRKTSGPAGNTYVQKFNGGLSYNIDTAVVTTTTCSSTNVTGTFTLWLSNTSGNKTVTGNFNCNQPSIL